MDIYLVLGIISVVLYYFEMKSKSPYLKPLYLAGLFGLFYFIYPQLLIIGFCWIITNVLENLYSKYIA